MNDDLDTSDEQGQSTRAVHAAAPARHPGQPVVPALVASSTYFNSAVPEGEVLYGRYANSDAHQRVGRRIASLEHAEAGLVCGSGMAAISLAILTFAGSGDHIVAARSLYGGTLQLIDIELPRLGIRTTFVAGDTDRDGDGDGGWAAAIRPETRALYVEVPVNPTLRVPDLRPIARIAEAAGVPLIVDATFATPINFRPLDHGAHLVVHSATKYLGGHSDLVAGVLAGPADTIATARQRLISFGPSLDPHPLWLLERGLKTLAVRVARQNETALALAHWLLDHPAVAAVHYPGLPSHPDHRTARELFDGFGGMLGFVVRGGDDAATDVMSRFRLIAMAPSLGGVESLASMPRHTSHAAMEPEARRAAGIEDGFIRLSVGIEDEPDIRADLAAALDGVA